MALHPPKVTLHAVTREWRDPSLAGKENGAEQEAELEARRAGGGDSSGRGPYTLPLPAAGFGRRPYVLG